LSYQVQESRELQKTNSIITARISNYKMAEHFGDYMNYVIKVDGTCNGKAFRVDGEGFADMNTGLHKVKAYCPEGTKLPLSWIAFGPIIQYGTMAFAKYDNGIKDWFKEQFPGGYELARKMDFHNGGCIKAKHVVYQDGDIIHNDVTCTVEGFDPKGAVMTDNILSINNGINMINPENGGMRSLCSYFMNRKDGGIENSSSDVFYHVPGKKPENFGVMPQHHGCIVKLSHSKDCSELRDHIVGEEYIRGFDPERSIQNMHRQNRIAPL